MTLRQFVEALITKDVKITIMENGEEIIKFYSEGYGGVESDILSRVVSKWEISSASAVTIHLEAVAP